MYGGASGANIIAGPVAGSVEKAPLVRVPANCPL